MKFIDESAVPKILEARSQDEIDILTLYIIREILLTQPGLVTREFTQDPTNSPQAFLSLDLASSLD